MPASSMSENLEHLSTRLRRYRLSKIRKGTDAVRSADIAFRHREGKGSETFTWDSGGWRTRRLKALRFSTLLVGPSQPVPQGSRCVSVLLSRFNERQRRGVCSSARCIGLVESIDGVSRRARQRHSQCSSPRLGPRQNPLVPPAVLLLAMHRLCSNHAAMFRSRRGRASPCRALLQTGMPCSRAD